MTGTISETYAAAVSNGLVDVGEATLVGVVRQPPQWFLGVVDENRRALGPPTHLLDEVRGQRESLKAGGMCDEGAHNAAWEECEFERRYLASLEERPEASEALDTLAARVREGESVSLVCFEGENKACHRRLLVERLRERVQ